MINWNEILQRSNGQNLPPDQRVEKTPEQWKQELDEETFYVTRQKGTEHPFSSSMCGLFKPGLYRCACCGTPLFNANEKFDSGTGWPSFTQPVADNAVDYIGDASHGMQRIETTCSSCDAHLGHVFPDGPPPTGLRYCINAVSLKRDGDD